jgi:tudor domain-containing protein 2
MGRNYAIEGNKIEEGINGTEYLTETLVASSDNGFVEVYVSAVESPSKFWVQVFGTKGIELDKLSDELSDFYELEENRDKTPKLSDLKVGDMVAAPYPKDDNWYRVRVVKVQEEGYSPDEHLVTVYYVDFGDEAVLPRKALCSLYPQFLTALPFQAIECCLSGVQSKDSGNWSEEAIACFTQLTHAAQWTKILAKPLKKMAQANGTGAGSGSGLVTLVELVDIQEQKDINIGEVMMSRGFAVKAEDSPS